MVSAIEVLIHNIIVWRKEEAYNPVQIFFSTYPCSSMLIFLSFPLRNWIYNKITFILFDYDQRGAE